MRQCGDLRGSWEDILRACCCLGLEGGLGTGTECRLGVECCASYCSCVLAGKLDEKKPPEADMK